ncbi:MAG: hypothetical protein NC086_04990 [Alistipes sp.]|nr:hypothetical protein [Alistipes sp.]
MNNYELEILFTEEALKAIYAAGEKIVITKEVAGSKGKSVCWVSTLPFLNNSIKWTEEYMLYASREEATNGATISKLSDVDAISEITYDFDQRHSPSVQPHGYIFTDREDPCMPRKRLKQRYGHHKGIQHRY